MFVYLFKGSIISTTLATGHHHDQNSFNAMQCCHPREAGNSEKEWYLDASKCGEIIFEGEL